MTYVIKNGLRHVTPYVNEFKTFAKKRWFGKTIWELFSTEFAAFPQDYYVRDLVTGVGRAVEHFEDCTHR